MTAEKTTAEKEIRPWPGRAPFTIAERKTAQKKKSGSQTLSLSIEESGGEEEDIAVTLFITQMAYALLEGRVTPTDIYEGMVLANCGDKNVARHIRDRAVAEAALYRVEEEEKKQEREALSTPKVLH